MSGLIGVLGGMGPLATVDFMNKVIEQTPATRDQDHVPMIVYCVPQIPGRPECILEGGESPLPAMLKGLSVLKHAGAECIAIPCNTAHYWYDDLCRESGLPILHIVDAAIDALKSHAKTGDAVGLIATRATLQAETYQRRLAARGYHYIVNTSEEINELVLPGICCIKEGQIERGGKLFERAAQNLKNQGARSIILGCTEIPVGLAQIRSPVLPFCVDPTRALAGACVKWWLNRRSGSERTAIV